MCSLFAKRMYYANSLRAVENHGTGRLLLAVYLYRFNSFSLYNAINSQQSIQAMSSQSVSEKSQSLLEAQAEINAREVKAYFDEAVYRAEMLIANAKFQKYNAEENFLPSEDLRLALDEMMRQAVIQFPSIQGAYLVFKPNMLDGEDGNYQGADYVGSNEQGQFATYWQMSATGENAVRTVLSKSMQDAMENGERFYCPLATESACVSTPRLSQVGEVQHLTSSLSIPIEVDSIIIGFLGIDLQLTGLAKTVMDSDSSLFSGDGHVNIISWMRALSPVTIQAFLLALVTKAKFSLKTKLPISCSEKKQQRFGVRTISG